MAKKEKDNPRPVCHGKPMIVNSRVKRVSGPRIVWRCTECGKTRTLPEEY